MVSCVKTDTLSFYEAAVRKAVRHIEDHLDDALDLGSLARHAALSPFHFHRVFRGLVGETPLMLHRRLRMERAAVRLAETERGVTEIAFEAGYDTHEAFTRAFRAAFGEPPAVFRRSLVEGAVSRPLTLASRSRIHYQEGGGRGALLDLFVEQGGLVMNVVIKDMPSMRLAAVHHKGPYPTIGEAFGKLGEIAGAAGLFERSTAMVAVYHDDPESTPADELRSDAALIVPEDAKLPKELAEHRLPAGRYACATHKGSYAGLPDAWAQLMGGWLPKSGHRVGNGESFEIYRNTPMTAKTEDLETDLYVPLA